MDANNPPRSIPPPPTGDENNKVIADDIIMNDNKEVVEGRTTTAVGCPIWNIKKSQPTPTQHLELEVCNLKKQIVEMGKRKKSNLDPRAMYLQLLAHWILGPGIEVGKSYHPPLDPTSTTEATNNNNNNNNYTKGIVSTPAPARKKPDVIFFHDSLGKKINDTIFSREQLQTSKVFTYHLDDIPKELEDRKESPKAIVIHVGTNDIRFKTNVQEITTKLDKMSCEIPGVQDYFN